MSQFGVFLTPNSGDSEGWSCVFNNFLGSFGKKYFSAGNGVQETPVARVSGEGGLYFGALHFPIR
jgi:hypothetical protein